MNTAQTDFLRAPRPPRIGWALLFAGVLALACAVWCEQRWASERSVALQARQEAQAALRVHQMPARPVEPTMAQRRWRQAQVEARRPWLRALRAVESATINPVFLLSMTIEPATGLIKLEAEAPTFDHALAYVQVLDIGGALEPAAMVSHEQLIDPVSGRGAVRFSTTTRWVAP